MILDIEFVIYSSLIIACLIPLYIYRKKILKFRNSNGNINLFLKDLRNYLSTHHPKIKFNFSIIDKTEDEKNRRVRETLIVEDIITQFVDYDYKKTTQASVSKEKLWVGYDEKSKSDLKLPSDWKQRKEMAWLRDNGRCDRCGNKILLKNAYSQFAKEIEKGGGYNFENIIILCNDCNLILKKKESKIDISSTEIYDKLMVAVDNN